MSFALTMLKNLKDPEADKYAEKYPVKIPQKIQPNTKKIMSASDSKHLKALRNGHNPKLAPANASNAKNKTNQNTKSLDVQLALSQGMSKGINS